MSRSALAIDSLAGPVSASPQCTSGVRCARAISSGTGTICGTTPIARPMSCTTPMRLATSAPATL